MTQFRIESVGMNPYCLKNWPECKDGLYNPACCRFPKSCSCDLVEIIPEDLADLCNVKRVKVKRVFSDIPNTVYKVVVMGIDTHGAVILMKFFGKWERAVEYVFNAQEAWRREFESPLDGRS